MTTLEPCPFCGAGDVSHGQGCGGDNGTEFIECEDCGITGPWRPTPEEAGAAWNQRAAPAASGDE